MNPHPPLSQLRNLHRGHKQRRPDMAQDRHHEQTHAPEPPLELSIGHHHRHDDPQASNWRDDEGTGEQHRQWALPQVDQIGAAGVHDISQQQRRLGGSNNADRHDQERINHRNVSAPAQLPELAAHTPQFMSSRYVIDGSRGTRYVPVSPSLSVMPGARFLPTQSPTDVHAEQVGTRSLADGSNRYRVIPPPRTAPSRPSVRIREPPAGLFRSADGLVVNHQDRPG